MLMVLSPAKSLDFDTPARVKAYTLPDFLAQSAELVQLLRALSMQQVAKMMSLSDSLAALNVARYSAWHPDFNLTNAKQAMFAFNGDVYEGLSAATLSREDIDFAQQHLRILSGLYGVLRPLDLIQPYRLEMSTPLRSDVGDTLYAFWDQVPTQQINLELGSHAHRVLINLASEEYFKVIRPKFLESRICTPVFQDGKNGQYKVVSVYAKRARGLMARYIITKKIAEPEALKAFDGEGYRYTPEVSDATKWVFRREQGV